MANIQWTTSDKTNYFPVGETTSNLPSGCYKVGETMQGQIFLEKQQLRNDGLIKLPDTNSQTVLEEIQKFWELKDKFAEEKTPYKRGIMLYGPPGSGKTSTLREVMEDVTQRGGIILEFERSHSFLDGYKMVREIHADKPIVAVMEDLDAIIDMNSESALLNVLDGVHDLNNIVFLATTNYPERLGSRIFNRPSRFDKRFKIGMPKAESRKTYLAHKGISEDVIDKWVKDTAGLSIAHLSELCTAVKMFGEAYEVAVKVIKGMESIPHSSLFDKSSVDATDTKVGREYYESVKNNVKSGKVMTEDLLHGGQKKTNKTQTMEDLISGISINTSKSTSKNTDVDQIDDIDQIADMM